MNPFKVLGIPEGSNENEIKESYRKLVKKFHPDINPNAKKETLLDIIKAYEILKANNWKHKAKNLVPIDLETLYRNFIRKNPIYAYYFNLKEIKSQARWSNFRNRP